MFRNQSSFTQSAIKWSLIWAFSATSLWGGVNLYDKYKEEKVKIVEKEKVVYKTTETASLGDLKQGQEIIWNGYKMCISSINTQNLKTTLTMNPAESEPPVTINIRHKGQCL